MNPGPELRLTWLSTDYTSSVTTTSSERVRRHTRHAGPIARAIAPPPTTRRGPGTSAAECRSAGLFPTYC